MADVKTVRMTRAEAQHEGGPTAADVHPDEVAGMEAAGWARAEGDAAAAPTGGKKGAKPAPAATTAAPGASEGSSGTTEGGATGSTPSTEGQVTTSTKPLEEQSLEEMQATARAEKIFFGPKWKAETLRKHIAEERAKKAAGGAA